MAAPLEGAPPICQIEHLATFNVSAADENKKVTAINAFINQSSPQPRQAGDLIATATSLRIKAVDSSVREFQWSHVKEIGHINISQMDLKNILFVHEKTPHGDNFIHLLNVTNAEAESIAITLRGIQAATKEERRSSMRLQGSVSPSVISGSSQADQLNIPQVRLKVDPKEELDALNKALGDIEYFHKNRLTTYYTSLKQLLQTQREIQRLEVIANDKKTKPKERKKTKMRLEELRTQHEKLETMVRTSLPTRQDFIEIFEKIRLVFILISRLRKALLKFEELEKLLTGVSQHFVAIVMAADHLRLPAELVEPMFSRVNSVKQPIMFRDDIVLLNKICEQLGETGMNIWRQLSDETWKTAMEDYQGEITYYMPKFFLDEQPTMIGFLNPDRIKNWKRAVEQRDEKVTDVKRRIDPDNQENFRQALVESGKRYGRVVAVRPTKPDFLKVQINEILEISAENDDNWIVRNADDITGTIFKNLLEEIGYSKDKLENFFDDDEGPPPLEEQDDSEEEEVEEEEEDKVEEEEEDEEESKDNEFYKIFLVAENKAYGIMKGNIEVGTFKAPCGAYVEIIGDSGSDIKVKNRSGQESNVDKDSVVIEVPLKKEENKLANRISLPTPPLVPAPTVPGPLPVAVEVHSNAEQSTPVIAKQKDSLKKSEQPKPPKPPSRLDKTVQQNYKKSIIARQKQFAIGRITDQGIWNHEIVEVIYEDSGKVLVKNAEDELRLVSKSILTWPKNYKPSSLSKRQSKAAATELDQPARKSLRPNEMREILQSENREVVVAKKDYVDRISGIKIREGQILEGIGQAAQGFYQVRNDKNNTGNVPIEILEIERPGPPTKEEVIENIVPLMRESLKSAAPSDQFDATDSVRSGYAPSSRNPPRKSFAGMVADFGQKQKQMERPESLRSGYAPSAKNAPSRIGDIVEEDFKEKQQRFGEMVAYRNKNNLYVMTREINVNGLLLRKGEFIQVLDRTGNLLTVATVDNQIAVFPDLNARKVHVKYQKPHHKPRQQKHDLPEIFDDFSSSSSDEEVEVVEKLRGARRQLAKAKNRKLRSRSRGDLSSSDSDSEGERVLPRRHLVKQKTRSLQNIAKRAKSRSRDVLTSISSCSESDAEVNIPRLPNNRLAIEKQGEFIKFINDSGLRSGTILKAHQARYKGDITVYLGETVQLLQEDDDERELLVRVADGTAGRIPRSCCGKEQKINKSDSIHVNGITTLTKTQSKVIQDAIAQRPGYSSLRSRASEIPKSLADDEVTIDEFISRARSRGRKLAEISKILPPGTEKEDEFNVGEVVEILREIDNGSVVVSNIAGRKATVSPDVLKYLGDGPKLPDFGIPRLPQPPSEPRFEARRQNPVNLQAPPPPLPSPKVDSLPVKDYNDSPPYLEKDKQQGFLRVILEDGLNACIVTRSRKGDDAKELTICEGEILAVVDDSRNWWNVRNASGKSGYVPRTFVREYHVSPANNPPPQRQAANRAAQQPPAFTPKMTFDIHRSYGHKPAVPANVMSELSQSLNKRMNMYHVKLSSSSGPEEVTAWMRSTNFSEAAVEQLGQYSAVELLGIAVNDLKELIGFREGRRMYNLLDGLRVQIRREQ